MDNCGRLPAPPSLPNEETEVPPSWKSEVSIFEIDVQLVGGYSSQSQKLEDLKAQK